MCPFQHWLTPTPIIVALTPIYTTCLFFVLQATHGYHCLVSCAKQLFWKIDGDNSIAACHQLFLTSAVTTNYVFQKKMTGTCWDFFNTYLVKFSFSRNDGRCRFLRPCVLTNHLSDDLWGYFTCFTLHCTLPFEVCLCTLSRPLKVIFDRTQGFVSSLCFFVYTSHFNE